MEAGESSAPSIGEPRSSPNLYDEFVQLRKQYDEAIVKGDRLRREHEQCQQVLAKLLKRKDDIVDIFVDIESSTRAPTAVKTRVSVEILDLPKAQALLNSVPPEEAIERVISLLGDPSALTVDTQPGLHNGSRGDHSLKRKLQDDTSPEQPLPKRLVV